MAATGGVVVAVAMGFVPFVVTAPLALQAVAGVVAIVAGGLLAVVGTVLATRGQRLPWRIANAAGALVATAALAFVVAPAVAATNVPRPPIGATPIDRGLAYESVTMTTSDGVRLVGWYLPSTNGAAVVLLHGAGSTRSDVLDEAVVLHRHGFGVLMVDARGHGESGGRAMDFGWNGDADIAAATGFLASRPDVDPRRIGVVGLSMGGEEALGASGSNALIRAVVAEGATARTAADEEWFAKEFGWRGVVQEQLEWLQDRVTDALTSAPVPTSLRAAVEASGTTRFLLVTAGNVRDEAHAAAYVAAGASDRVEVWTVPDAGHTGGLAAEPATWEARVIGFLRSALATRSTMMRFLNRRRARRSQRAVGFGVDRRRGEMRVRAPSEWPLIRRLNVT